MIHCQWETVTLMGMLGARGMPAVVANGGDSGDRSFPEP